MNKKKHTAQSEIDIRISLKDLKLLAGKRFDGMRNAAINFAYCVECGTSKMNSENIKTSINRLGDVLWDGNCVKCGNSVTRYLELGEDPDFFDRAMTMRKMKIETLAEYEIREHPGKQEH